MELHSEIKIGKKTINIYHTIIFLGPLKSKYVDEGEIGDELNQSTEESGDELVVPKKSDPKNSRKLKRPIQQSSLSFENELHPSKRQKELSQTVSQKVQLLKLHSLPASKASINIFHFMILFFSL